MLVAPAEDREPIGGAPKRQGSERALSRRGVLWGAAGLGVGALGGAGAAWAGAASAGAASAGNEPKPGADQAAQSAVGMGDAVDPFGSTQAGVVRPETPQANTLLTVAALPDLAPRADAVRDLVEALGAAVLKCTLADRTDPSLLPDGPGNLTVTVGLGPRLVRLVDASMPGSVDLPLFRGDEELGVKQRGGDLMLSVCANDQTILAPVTEYLLGTVGGAVNWAQSGSRAPGTGTIARNPLGFRDGVIVPRGSDEINENVWISEGSAAGGSICVVRRLDLDTIEFAKRTLDEQQRIVGREKVTGVPLSGGGPDAEVDLLAKSPDGAYLTPRGSHVRAAHPSFTGSALMLRRGYGYAQSGSGELSRGGLLFVCFQRDLETFVRTQLRLDEQDELMRFATVTATGTFLILPGSPSGVPFVL